ncbi:Squalene-hopene cyclase [Paenibacillus darwinianus]|uniref:Squalene-hopene cyclase n=1 Tax=Paenibacillus darwinianus TaxID=1380763 RepID=A0A9W5W781_9BACL|nr:DinB family protein [Paenibacillus darwinianus]EXX87910.1 Squalene-hopene cyclase [Paenibacillus darwinianus]EXX88207.1 Squalene-hopene cyclase [Paenibacillus darwinianus]EXX88428.1 Squalene-hopene cyclase [Paenibacillus darwinianus]
MEGRPDASEYLPQMGQYVKLVPDGDLIEILQRQKEETVALLRGLSEEQADYRYAEGKWSVKEVAGHVADNERVWTYRLLRIVRNDPQTLSGYDQNMFARHAPFGKLPLSVVIDEFAAVRAATIPLLRSLSDDAWLRQGEFHNRPLSARAAACVIVGHEMHHLNVIKNRYLNR